MAFHRCGRLKAFEKAIIGTSGIEMTPVGIVVTADESRSDIWVEDGSMAAEHIQPAAFDLVFHHAGCR